MWSKRCSPKIVIATSQSYAEVSVGLKGDSPKVVKAHARVGIVVVGGGCERLVRRAGEV